ncbi:hypothetical protein D3C71_1634600 [compost metagenome]
MEMMTKSAVMMSQTVLTSPPLSAEIELRPRPPANAVRIAMAPEEMTAPAKIAGQST